MNEQFLVSIVVPVYNVSAFLDRCVQSIVNQNYTNLEIILVDDGSTDQSGDKCDQWGKKDSRIVIYHKENGGLSDARNFGIKKSSGQYIAFIDSDDYVLPNYVEMLVSILIDKEADISITDFFVTRNKEYMGKETRFLKTYIYNAKDAIEVMCYQKYFGPSACGKLYRRECFENIQFPVGTLYEDIAVMYKIFAMAKKIVYSPIKTYAYYKRSGSIVNGCFSVKKMNYVEHTEEMLEYINVTYPDIRNAAISRFVWANFHVLMQIPYTCKFEIYKTTLIKNIKKYGLNVLLNRKVRLSNKIIVFLGLINMNLLRYVYRKTR